MWLHHSRAPIPGTLFLIIAHYQFEYVKMNFEQDRVLEVSYESIDMKVMKLHSSGIWDVPLAIGAKFPRAFSLNL